MKNDFLKTYQRKLLLRILLTVTVPALLFVFLIALIDSLSNGFVLDIITHIFGMGFASFLIEYKLAIMLVCCLLLMIVFWFISQVKLSKDLTAILNSIDTVFRKDESMVALPTDFREIETKLNTIKYQTIRSEQIAREAEQRKNDLVVYLAHDLKTPLTSVIGYLSLLNDEPDLPPELRAKYTGISLKKAERLEELINEFFDITRFNLQGIILEKGWLNLDMMLKQLSDEFYPMLEEKKLACSIQVQNGLTIFGDADKLARVFDNLLRNAISYSYEGSTIFIQAGAENGWATIVFINRGPMIPEHKLSTIFEKFYRLDPSRSSGTGGAGLGLAIAREIVELHNGSITARSDSEQTTFTVLLPV